MLYAIGSNGNHRKISRVPHPQQFRHWIGRLPTPAYDRLSLDLRRRFDASEIHTSSWIPGHDWRGTVFEPLYEACARDEASAAQFFGLILWALLMEDYRSWAFGRYEKDGAPIAGLTYFRIRPRY